MPNGGWGGDLNAAKMFHTELQQRALGDDRRSRGGARGGRSTRGARGAGALTGRGGSNMTRGGSTFHNTSFANNGNGRHNLAAAPPAHFWEPVDRHTTQITQAADAEDPGDPSNIDDRGIGGSLWASGDRAAADPPPARHRASSPFRGLGSSAHAAVDNNINDPRAHGPAESQSAFPPQTTRCPGNTFVSSVNPFTKVVQNIKPTYQGVADGGQGTASAIEGGRRWPGLDASRHAGPVGHRQSIGLRRDLLQENGLLIGVKFSEDKGPQQDDDWIKSYNLNKVKEECLSVVSQAIAASDYEAENALRKVIVACDEVLRAKNDLKDKKLQDEAEKILVKSQQEAWAHWSKYRRRVVHAAEPAAARKAQIGSANVKMQDAPEVVSQPPEQVQVPRAPNLSRPQPQGPPATSASLASAQGPELRQVPKLAGTDTRGFGPISFEQQLKRITQNDGFDRPHSGAPSLRKPKQMSNIDTQKAQAASPEHIDSPQFGGFHPTAGVGFSNTQQVNAWQTDATSQQPQSVQQSHSITQPTENTGLPSMFPQGLPDGFDDAQARKIFEDLFFQKIGK